MRNILCEEFILKASTLIIEPKGLDTAAIVHNEKKYDIIYRI